MGEPSEFLVEVEPELGSPARALDVAGGLGRNALWLAGRGWEVTLLDRSVVALRRAATEARRRGVSLRTARVDLDREPLPGEGWHLIVWVHYLNRPVLTTVADRLSPGGRAVVEIATVRNLERHPRPPRPYLLEEGEAPGLLSGLLLLRYEEGWTDDGHHQARLLGRKPVGGPPDRRLSGPAAE